MNRKNLSIVLLFALVFFCGHVSAVVSDVDRMRIIGDLIKDGTTTAGDAAYNGLDKLNAARALVYANDFWLVYDGRTQYGPTIVESPTNGQLSQFSIRQIRKHIENVHSRALEIASDATVKTTAATEVATDLGID